MAKEAVFHHPVSRPLMRGMKHIPVDRDSGLGAYRHAVRALEDGELVGVFPEATISRSFELKGFKSGAVRMAQEAQVPIVPIVVWGSQRIWTKGHRRRLGRTNIPVSIRVGAPLRVEADAPVPEAMAVLRAQMLTMLTAAQEAYQPLTGSDLVFLAARKGGTAPTRQVAEQMDHVDQAARRAARTATASKDTAPPQAPDTPNPYRPRLRLSGPTRRRLPIAAAQATYPASDVRPWTEVAWHTRTRPRQGQPQSKQPRAPGALTAQTA